MVRKPLRDRRRDIACVFLLFSIGGFWWSLRSDQALPREPLWVNVLLSGVLLMVAVGIWRATEWARWVGGLVGLVEAVQYGWMLAAVLTHGSTASAPFALPAALGFFAIWWAAIAFYLLKPSTKRLFALVRDARSGGQRAPA